MKVMKRKKNKHTMEKLLEPDNIIYTIVELEETKEKIPHPHWNGLPAQSVKQRLDTAIEALQNCLILTKTI